MGFGAGREANNSPSEPRGLSSRCAALSVRYLANCKIQPARIVDPPHAAATAVRDAPLPSRYAGITRRQGAWMSDASTPTAAGEPFDFTATVGMLSIAVGGTALAGGAFPIVMVAAGAIGNVVNGSLRPIAGLVVDAVAIIILGGMVGFMIALVVGFLLGLIALLVAWLCSLPAGTVWFESLVGGWAGFFSTHTLLEGLQPNDSYLLLGLAVVTGQLGAGGAVFLYRRQRRSANEAAPEGRVGLRQLFGITTSIALLAALARGIELDSLVYSTLWLAVAIQSGLIALWYFWCARRPRPHPEVEGFT